MYIGLCGYQTHAASELFWKVAKFQNSKTRRTNIPDAGKADGRPGLRPARSELRFGRNLCPKCEQHSSKPLRHNGICANSEVSGRHELQNGKIWYFNRDKDSEKF